MPADGGDRGLVNGFPVFTSQVNDSFPAVRGRSGE